MVVILISTSVVLWAQKLQHNKNPKKLQKNPLYCVHFRCIVGMFTTQHFYFVVLPKNQQHSSKQICCVVIFTTHQF